LPYTGPNDWSASTEITSPWLDNLESGVSAAPSTVYHNGTAWPARTTVTTDVTHRVDWIGPAPLPTDFVVGPDMLYDTAAQASVTSAPYRVAGHPLFAPLPNGGSVPWQGTPASWTAPAAAASVVKADTAVTLAGDTSYTLVTAGNNAFVSGVNATQPAFNVTANPGYALAVWIWVSDPTRVASMSVYAGSSSGNSYYWDILLAAPAADKPVLFPGRWRKFTLHPGFANVQGSPVATAISRVVFNVNDNNTPVTVRISNRMEWEPVSSASFPAGVVSFDFDDSYASVKLAAPLFGQRGWRASLAPILSFIGGSGSLTWDDIKEFQGALGWPVKSHCRYNTTPVAEHNGFTTLTEQQMIDAITATRDTIAGQGLFGSEDWAATNGAYGTGVEPKMVAQIIAPYIRSARVTQSLRSIDTLPPADRYMLANRSDVGGPSLGITNYTAANGILDKVVASKGWAHITLHSVIASGTAASNQINVADLTTLLASIAAKGITVLPTAEVLEALR
jgi:hypothetical protein